MDGGTSNTYGSMGGNFKAAYPEVAMKGKRRRKWKILSNLAGNNQGKLASLPKLPEVPKGPKY